MRNFIALSILLFATLCFFSGCMGTSSSISSYRKKNWYMEVICYTGGKNIAVSPKNSDSETPAFQMTCFLGTDNTFTITRKDTNESWVGTYEETGSGTDFIRLSMTFEDTTSGEAVIGIRKYQDNSSTGSLTVTTGDISLSFIDEE